MRRAALGVTAGLALAGCIPQVDPPYRDAPPPEQSAYPPRAAAPQDSDARFPSGERRRPALPAQQVEPDRSAGEDDIPASPPAWETRPVTPDAQVIPDSTYVVRPGDTLTRVAERTGSNEAAIGQANDLVPPYALTPGERLTIPGGRYHLVRRGQSGIAIARAYGVEWSRIVAANDLTEPYVLRVGQRIRIPGPPAGSTGLAERAAAFQLDIDDILTGGEPAATEKQASAKPATRRHAPPPTAVVAALTRLRGGFLWPVDGEVVKRFGTDAGGERNDGVELAVPVSTPVRAAADGVVAYAGTGVTALGGVVIIKHGDGWASVYGHARKLLVRRGEEVKQGETIALSGETGDAERPELHFELRKGRTPVDPESELPET